MLVDATATITDWYFIDFEKNERQTQPWWDLKYDRRELEQIRISFWQKARNFFFVSGGA